MQNVRITTLEVDQHHDVSVRTEEGHRGEFTFGIQWDIMITAPNLDEVALLHTASRA
jgi:hypothetical protein